MDLPKNTPRRGTKIGGAALAILDMLGLGRIQFGPGRRSHPTQSGERCRSVSTARQDARHARTQTTRVINGFELMQTLPSRDRAPR